VGTPKFPAFAPDISGEGWKTAKEAAEVSSAAFSLWVSAAKSGMLRCTRNRSLFPPAQPAAHFAPALVSRTCSPLPRFSQCRKNAPARARLAMPLFGFGHS